MRTIDDSVLNELKCESELDLQILNEFYYPDKKIPHPFPIGNSYGRENKKFQRLLKRNIRSRKKIIEIGCGTGSFTIPLANTFSDCEFIAIEQRASILYAILKMDLHNLASSKEEYFELIKEYIPEYCRMDDEKNHPRKFKKIENLKFIPEDSFDLERDKFNVDFVFAAFVFNNYYPMGPRSNNFEQGLFNFVESMTNLVNPEKGKVAIIDGNFKSRGFPYQYKSYICREFGLKYKKLHDDKNGNNFAFIS